LDWRCDPERIDALVNEGRKKTAQEMAKTEPPLNEQGRREKVAILPSPILLDLAPLTSSVVSSVMLPKWLRRWRVKAIAATHPHTLARVS
jgi:hypothetical protein